MKKQAIGGLLLAASLLLTASLSGCGSKSGGPVKIRIGEVTRSLFYAPEYVALSKGFSRTKGLKSSCRRPRAATRR